MGIFPDILRQSTEKKRALIANHDKLEDDAYCIEVGTEKIVQHSTFGLTALITAG